MQSEKNHENIFLGVAVLWLLGVSLVHPFFPVDILSGAEIMPGFLIMLFLAQSYKKRLFPAAIIGCCIVIAVLACVYLVRPDAHTGVIVDLLEFIVVGASVFLINNLTDHDLAHLEKVLFYLGCFFLLLMLFQKFLPEFMLWSNKIAIFRESAMLVDHRHGGVRGLGPEPAYTAAVWLSVLIFSYWRNELKNMALIIVCFSIILLTGSASGIGMLLLVVSMMFALSRSRRSFKLFSFVFLLLAAFLGLIPGVDRVLNLFHTAFFRFDQLLLFEKELGSGRMNQLFQTFFMQSGGYLLSAGSDYRPGYSLLSSLSAFLFPLSYVLISFFLFFVRTKAALISLVVSTLYGPILFPLFYVGFLVNRGNKGLHSTLGGGKY